MLLGYENTTHTVIRFKRNLDTCDMKDDFPITNDTMRVLFLYSKEKPRSGPNAPLPQPLVAFKGSRSIFLTQRSAQDELSNAPSVSILELRNEDVELPDSDESLYWCKIFKLDDFAQKHHLVRVSRERRGESMAVFSIVTSNYYCTQSLGGKKTPYHQ
uniref:Uncharacterized protein n=1 Tax=Anopheles melas TaxID=34690 RepID=A0A182TK92_9DIPT